MRKYAAVILLTGFLVPTASASLENDIRRCAAIDNNLGRLECFDRMAQKLPPLPPGEAVSAPKGKLSFRERWFGLEQKKTEASANEIHSTIPGDFTGWAGKTWFKLANGQEWVQIDGSRLVTRLKNPAVTIKRSFTGAYYLKVEGNNKRCKVRRAN